MSLELKIIRQPQGSEEVEPRKTFGPEGGTIGRAQGNGWQLPDKERYVSSKHAQIDCHDGGYYIVDVSTNGVYLNDSEEPLGTGNRGLLKDGDVIVIGDYEIQVRLKPVGYNDSPFTGMTAEMKALNQEGISFDHIKSQACPAELQKPLQVESSDDEMETSECLKSQAETQADIELAAEIEEIEQQSFSASRQPVDNKGDIDLGSSSVTVEVSDPKRNTESPPEKTDRSNALPPESVALPSSVDDDPSSCVEGGYLQGGDNNSDIENRDVNRNALKSEDNLNQTFERKRVGVDLVPGKKEQAEELARILGIPAYMVGEEQVEAITQLMAVVLKESVGGLMNSLRIRNQLKQNFRVASTSIQTSENNPLKLSVSVEEALEHILVRRGRGYLAPTETIRQSFKDIDDHQKAVPAAMKNAFYQLIDRFNPDSIQEKCDKNSTGIRPGSKKARYWDAFLAMYAQQVTDEPECYQRLFIDAFSEAYEELIMKSNK